MLVATTKRKKYMKEYLHEYRKTYKPDKGPNACSSTLCTKERAKGFKRCKDCIDYGRAYQMSYRRVRKVPGVCSNYPGCKKATEANFRQCSHCRALSRARTAKRKHENR